MASLQQVLFWERTGSCSNSTLDGVCVLNAQWEGRFEWPILAFLRSTVQELRRAALLAFETDLIPAEHGHVFSEA